MDMNSPNSGNGEKDNMGCQWSAGRPRPAEPFDSAQGRLARRPLLHRIQQTRNAFAKIGWFSDQAQHKMALVRKIIKVAGMDAHTRRAQQSDSKLFVTIEGRDAEHNVPSTLNQQSRARGMACELPIEFREIHAQTIEENGLDLFALIDQYPGRNVHGSVHREKGISDDFESRSCLRDHCFGAAGRHPCKLHLWKGRNLGHSAESESERVGVADETAPRRAIMRIIEKHFVHNQSQTAVTAESIECRGFRSRSVGTGWDVGMY